MIDTVDNFIVGLSLFYVQQAQCAMRMCEDWATAHASRLWPRRMRQNWATAHASKLCLGCFLVLLAEDPGSLEEDVEKVCQVDEAGGEAGHPHGRCCLVSYVHRRKIKTQETAKVVSVVWGGQN